MAGDIYYGYDELKRMVGNNCNRMANDFETLADMADTEEAEIKFQNVAGFLRQFADEELFSKPIRYEGNVIDFDEFAYKRRG
jgi:hypothetical protein